MKINWHIKHFNELTTETFHDIIQLREEIFIVEQNCPYLDVDGKDLNATHVFAYNDKKQLLATSRILKPGTSYDSASIGRVCVSQKARRLQLGKELMIQSINFSTQNYGRNITISAQTYLLNFYSDLGFKKSGREYLEDGIPHFKMTFNLNKF